jgi:hypothetical protein
MAAHPLQYRTWPSPPGGGRKEIPLAWTPRQPGLQGQVRRGSAGRAVRRDDAAAETPPFATGADVDCGLLAGGQRSYETFGGKPRPLPAFGRERPWASSSLAAHTAARRGLTARVSLRWNAALGTQWGQMDGRGNRAPSLVVGARPPAAGRPSPAPLPSNCPGPRATLSSGGPSPARPRRTDSYLVDSASSHMLVSKIKPCMSKYKQLYCETANGSLNQLSFI